MGLLLSRLTPTAQRPALTPPKVAACIPAKQNEVVLWPVCYSHRVTGDCQQQTLCTELDQSVQDHDSRNLDCSAQHTLCLKGTATAHHIDLGAAGYPQGSHSLPGNVDKPKPLKLQSCLNGMPLSLINKYCNCLRQTQPSSEQLGHDQTVHTCSNCKLACSTACIRRKHRHLRIQHTSASTVYIASCRKCCLHGMYAAAEDQLIYIAGDSLLSG